MFTIVEDISIVFKVATKIYYFYQVLKYISISIYLFIFILNMFMDFKGILKKSQLELII